MQGDHAVYYHALYRVALLVNSSLDPREVLGAVVHSVADAMRARACSLRLLDRSGTVLEMAAAYGLSERYLNKGSVAVAASPIDRQALRGEVVSVQDVQADTRLQYPEELAQEGIVSMLCAPLIRHQTPIGVMRVYTEEPRRFDQDEIDFLQALADICALSIENARMYDALQRTYEVGMEALWGSAGR
jgi:signal transduction protein with GAF and PtsI domain